MITSVIETTLLFSCTNISWLFLHNVSYCFGNCEFLGRGNGHKYYLPFSLALLSPLPVPAYFNSVNSAFQQPTYTPTQFVSKLNASGGTGGGEGAEQDLKGRQSASRNVVVWSYHPVAGCLHCKLWEPSVRMDAKDFGGSFIFICFMRIGENTLSFRNPIHSLPFPSTVPRKSFLATIKLFFDCSANNKK